jgi:Ca2+-binding EF-hand superfamily protein
MARIGNRMKQEHVLSPMEKREKTTDGPTIFDTGGKGFLTYEEYVGYCLSILKQPLDRKSMGDRIRPEDVRFRKTESELDGVFDFFSCNSGSVTTSTLKKAAERLSIEIPDEDITEMIYFFSPRGGITREAFESIFD